MLHDARSGLTNKLMDAAHKTPDEAREAGRGVLMQRMVRRRCYLCKRLYAHDKRNTDNICSLCKSDEQAEPA
jgi:type II secretory ATPase GspE/PulE/Tfp pilus assembly ATPase PilB-like protein